MSATAFKTTAQSLGSLLKSARDIMRKDKGLNGDLDRLPMLTWIMFLKFLDDLELQGTEEAKLAGKKFKAAIEPPYRWRDWAANPQGIRAMNFWRSSIMRKPCARTASVGQACSIICVGSLVPIRQVSLTLGAR